MKYEYLKSWQVWAWLQRLGVAFVPIPLPFLHKIYWRRISRERFIAAVRPYFFNSADDDVIVMYEHDPTLFINDGKHIYRVKVRGT